MVVKMAMRAVLRICASNFLRAYVFDYLAEGGAEPMSQAGFIDLRRCTGNEKVLKYVQGLSDGGDFGGTAAYGWRGALDSAWPVYAGRQTGACDRAGRWLPTSYSGKRPGGAGAKVYET